MDWYAIDTWIVVIGATCAMACALLGNFLVLRRMSMMGDAISHAVLPGLAAAFLITQSRASLTMFIGAAIVGVLTALFTQWVHTFGKVDSGASMGIVFTTLFAIGLIMIVQSADDVDLDPGCVLYGLIEFTPLDTWVVGGLEVPRAAVTLGGVLLLNSVFVLAFFKELKISSFDPALATTLGINAKLMHYVLMTLVAVTTVASFESIGSILVIAMLIVPAAAAHLLTDRLGSMIAVSLVFAALSAALGHVAAITVPRAFGFEDTSTAGMMAAVAGLMFTLVMLLAPRHGVLSKLYHRAMLSSRILSEDLLGLLYRLEEIGVAGAESSRFVESPEGVATKPRLVVPESPGFSRTQPQPLALLRQALGVGPVISRLAFARLGRAGEIVRDDGGYHLTEAGRRHAADLVRTHRLWESFLAKHLAVPSDHLHAPAERLEHVTNPAMQHDLATASEHPTHDPHGKRVPEGQA